MNAEELVQPMFAVSTLMEYLILIGAILLVAGVVVVWAAIIRKPKGERRYKYHRAPRGQAPPPPPQTGKRKRRSEPPRNPTLAETRGLPPVRESQSASDERYQY